MPNARPSLVTAHPADPYAIGRALAGQPELARLFRNLGAVRDSMRAQMEPLREYLATEPEGYSFGFVAGEMSTLSSCVEQLTALLAGVALP